MKKSFYIKMGLLIAFFVLLPAGAIYADNEFIWPVSGWVPNTHAYDPAGNDLHGGSADISAQLWTPIVAARDGIAIPTLGEGTEGTGVTIDHGNGITTWYGHNLQSTVSVGQTVQSGDVIGYVGATSALMPHVHFAIAKDGARQAIPGLQFGQWVAQGEFIPGSWGLSPIIKPAFTYNVRSVVDALELRSEPNIKKSAKRTVPNGTTLTVLGAVNGNGFYQVRYNNVNWWVVRSGVEPEASEMFWVKTNADVDVRSGPDESNPIIGNVAIDIPVGVYESQNGWYLIQFKKCGISSDYTEYGWIPVSVATMNADFFQTRKVRVDLPVRKGPGANFKVIGTITYAGNKFLTFYENKNGWYRILFNNTTGWVEGWKTGGIQAVFSTSQQIRPASFLITKLRRLLGLLTSQQIVEKKRDTASFPPNRISVTATDANAVDPSNTGRFLIRRRADDYLNTRRVWYTLGGTAVRGIDYDLASTFWSPFSDSTSNSVVIPPGNNSVATELYIIPKNPISDNKTVTLTLSSDSGYELDMPSETTITLGPVIRSFKERRDDRTLDKLERESGM
ncbi:MAG TPA: SH3 domain-containing protein [Thermodesulfobacteriota bacterium]|nr:SH3 domain-containing protein [Thermodesulfobacteriota bacterium]